MAFRNIKLTICYDGASYHGWQIQPDRPTIQGGISEALEKLTGQAVPVNGASRTDAGVSAAGQVANLKIDTPIPTENLAAAITAKLPEDIAVTEAVEVDMDFDAAASAKRKLYMYTLCTDKVRPVFQIRHCWHRPGELDVKKMAKAAKLLKGKKDFKSFASAADTRQNSVRTIFACLVRAKGGWLFINVEGDGFLYNMVRNIVGTLVEVGRGRWPAEKITEIIAARDRSAAGPIAPARGLRLMWIKY